MPDVVVKVNMSHNRPNSYSISVQGVPSIRRAIINIKDSNDHRGKKGDKELLVEGYGLQKVMTTQGIVGEQTTSNHVIEVSQVLGIEAARKTIINEINYTMKRMVDLDFEWRCMRP